MATTQQATSAGEVARGYFGALGRRDRNAQRDWYHDDSGAHQCPCVNGRTPSATRASSPAPGPCPTLPVAIATAHSPVTNAAVNGARRSHEKPYRGACRHHFRAARGDGCWDCRASSAPRVGPLTPGPRIHIRRGTNTTPPGGWSPLTTARPGGGPSTIVSHVPSR